MAKKKKLSRGSKLLMALIAVVLIVAAIITFTDLLQVRKAGFVLYDEFGIEMPVEYSIHGIDVSKYQQHINWETVSDMHVRGISIRFAFIKATEGNINVDRFFKRNWKRAGDTRLARGAYHFFIATKSGKTQAENFIKVVDLETGDLPPVLDVEQTYGVSGELLRKRVKEWLTTAENYYKVRPIIYTNVDFYQRHLGDEFDEYPLWVAHYLQKRRPRIHRDWMFWQHSELGKVNGINSNVDFNVFNGDSTDFRQVLVP